ncbi:MAG: transglycosylase SLT domain-containing protein [Candidatus Electrothrix sp. YB6]
MAISTSSVAASGADRRHSVSVHSGTSLPPGSISLSSVRPAYRPEGQEQVGRTKKSVTETAAVASDKLVLAILPVKEPVREAPLYTPVQSEQELKEELAALDRVGNWKIDEQTKSLSGFLLSGQCKMTAPLQTDPDLYVDSSTEMEDAADPATASAEHKQKKVEKQAQQADEKTENAVCDFPVIINRQVEFYLDQFRNKQRRTFRRWLERSTQYLPVIEQELKKADLPRSLAYLAMIESGFKPSAYSHAHAAGLWQFIPSTARNYGLRIDSWVDERRDTVKATKAAVAYLDALYRRFGDWQLAVAAYNAGEGKIERGLAKYRVDNFWDLADHKYLSLETKRYVPKLIAAILIAEEPEKYGFTRHNYKKKLAYEIVRVPPRTPLKTIAAAGSFSVSKLRYLNNELLRDAVPPSKGKYALKVPAGSRKNFLANLEQTHAGREGNMDGRITHRLRRGETLSEISQRYGVSVARIMRWNNIDDVRRIPAGRKLALYPSRKHQTSGSAVALLDVSHASGKKKKNAIKYYKVRNGDSLWSIARKLEVSMQEIKRWNSLDGNQLYPGTKLVIRKS